jgi:hypothetical protein
MSRGSLTLKGLEKEIEVGGRRHVVKVIDGGAVKEKQNGKIEVVCYEGHLEGFMRYIELAEAIAGWLEETSR